MLIGPGIPAIAFSRRAGIAPVGGSAAGALLDTMTAANGTSLAVHPLDIGGSWTIHLGTGSIQNNKLESGTSGTPLIASALSGFSDGTPAADFTAPGSGQFSVELLCRMSDANTGIAFAIQNDGIETTASIIRMNGLV